jgi:hypothetical protein
LNRRNGERQENAERTGTTEQAAAFRLAVLRSSVPLVRSCLFWFPRSGFCNLHVSTTNDEEPEHFGSDLLVGYTGMLGNFRTSVIGDIGMRVGYRMTSAYGSLSTRPGSEGRLIPPSHASPWGMHVGVTLAGEAVAYDVTLDGRLFHDDHVQVDREPLLARLGMVVGAHIGNLQIFALLVESTDTFTGEKQHPNYGRLIASWAF